MNTGNLSICPIFSFKMMFIYRGINPTQLRIFLEQSQMNAFACLQERRKFYYHFTGAPNLPSKTKTRKKSLFPVNAIHLDIEAYLRSYEL